MRGRAVSKPEPLDALVRRLLRGGWCWDVSIERLEVGTSMQLSFP